MHVQLTGEIGPFLDTVQQRQVSVVVLASCKYASMGGGAGQAQMEQQIQGQMLRAIHETIAPRMASHQLSFSDLGMGNTAAIIPEILARSGLAQAGIAVDKLVMSFGIDGHPPQPLPTPQGNATAPSAQNLNMKVGGINVHAGPGGIDTAGIKDQLVERAKSTLRWWAFGAFIVLIVLVGVAGLGLYIFHSIKNPPPPPAAAAKAAEKAAEKPHPTKK